MTSQDEDNNAHAEGAASPSESPQQRSRAYQQEMLDTTLEGNTIIAMGTGSGKTHIAVRRISVELDKQIGGKRVWFLAPTIVLCKQQCQVISLQLPAVTIKLLTGNDGVDRWKNQQVWDAALRGVSIVVSTYAVLSDALDNGFVRIGELALLIFDEAHHCKLNHPANNIMKNFYHTRKEKRAEVPHILGLTASPVIRSVPAELHVIEANLDSTVRTPRLHVEDLLKFVHPAFLREVHYEVEPPGEQVSPGLRSLYSIVENIAVEKEVSTLKSSSDHQRQGKHCSVVNHASRRIEKCLKDLCSKAKHLQKELGMSATDYYLTAMTNKINSSLQSEGDIILDLEEHERKYMIKVCTSINRSNSRDFLESYEFPNISAKVESLISILVAEHAPDFLGIVFVEQRAAAVALHQLLSTHPIINEFFRCGTFMGTSKSPSSKDFGDLVNPKEQDQILSDFATGDKNLIIATPALDEGVDVSGCNNVICFNKPQNIKSFIQRRGRARKVGSIFTIMVPEGENVSTTRNWQELEREMIEAYGRDRKLAEDLQEIESIEEEGDLKLDSESTEAKLNLGNAVRRLYRFCSMLPKQPYVDSSPTFMIEIDQLTNVKWARVILPNSVHHSVRQARGSKGWQTEKKAKADAAFQSYSALYYAGLVNDHFVPVPKDTLEIADIVENSPSILEVAEQHNPWVNVANEWREVGQIFRSRISICYQSQKLFDIDLVLPTKRFLKSRFPLFVSDGITFEALIDDVFSNDLSPCSDIHLLQDATELILRSVHNRCIISNHKDFVALFVPPVSQPQLEAWIKACSGPDEGTEISVKDVAVCNMDLIRYEDFISSPLRGAHRLKDNPIIRKCITGYLPLGYTRFSLFAPSIYHHLEVSFVAEDLCNRMKPHVRFTKIDLIIAAISVVSAEERPRYRQLAILGDTVLKFLTVTKLFAIHAKWHQEYLSKKRALITCNSRLTRAALDTGLDQFLITKLFDGRSWRPPYVSELKSHCVSGTRLISAKVLADVVKAMIGAAFLDGSYAEASKCVTYFLPDAAEYFHKPILESYVANRPARMKSAERYVQLERLLGYSFQEKSLLVESMTHGSYEGDYLIQSYRRLAFLGDGVLDMIVFNHLAQHVLSHSRSQIHNLKVASINSHFLAFLCMDYCAEIEVYGVDESPTGEFSETTNWRMIHLWEFMRYHNLDITQVRRENIKRYQGHGDLIRHGLSSGTTYPWQDLRNMNADSYFSDIIQSLFGAVYVDSRGDLSQCTLLATKIGLIGYLQRFIQDGVNLSDPNNLEGQQLIEISLSKSGMDEEKEKNPLAHKDDAEETD